MTVVAEHCFSYEFVDFAEGPALTLRGEVDATAAADLRNGLQELVTDAHSSVFVDLSRVTFIDSSGVAALIDASERTSTEGSLVMVDPSPPCRLVLDAVGLHDYEYWLP
jgi:anti-sigma B factor antagonist